jgi:hypothetical protein
MRLRDIPMAPMVAGERECFPDPVPDFDWKVVLKQTGSVHAPPGGMFPDPGTKG